MHHGHVLEIGGAREVARVVHGFRIEPVLVAGLRLVLFREGRFGIAPPTDLQRLAFIGFRAILRVDAALQRAVLCSG